MEKHSLQVGGLNVAYLREGSGTPILLLHGITTYSFIWEDLIPGLSARFEVFAPDLVGCGDSDKSLTVSYSLTAHAERLIRFADQVGLERFHLVGHDLGGGIAQIMSVKYPDRILSLSLFNSVAYDFWPVQPIIAMRTPIVRQLMMAAVDLGAFRLIIRRGLYHKDRLTEEVMERFNRPLQDVAGRKAFLHFAKCLDNRNLTDIADRLPSLPMPVQIVRGDADPYLSADISLRLNEAIPGSILRRIPTASHFIQIDEPQLLIEIVNDFIR